MAKKPITDPNAAEFMARMKGVRTHRVARALTRACTNAVSFYGCSKSHCANVWASASFQSGSNPSDYRFASGTTLDTLYADATSEY